MTEVSTQDLADVYHLLSLLESDAAGVVAINERFHMRLLAIANNRWRDQMVADLRKVMKLNRHNSLLKTGRIAESLAEH